MRALLALVVVAVSASCTTAAALGPLPAATASLPERVSAFERWRPVDERAIRATENGVQLRLNNGTVVDEPHDLAVMVAPTSATMVHAHKADDADAIANGFGVAGIAVASLGLAVEVGTLGYTLVTLPGRPAGARVPDGIVDGVAGGLGLCVVSLLALAPISVFGDVGAHEKVAAFHVYGDDLRARLDLTDAQE